MTIFRVGTPTGGIDDEEAKVVPGPGRNVDLGAGRSSRAPTTAPPAEWGSNPDASEAPTIANANPDTRIRGSHGPRRAPPPRRSPDAPGEGLEFIKYGNFYDSRWKQDQKQYKNGKPEGGGKSIIDLPYNDVTTDMAKKRHQFIHLYHIPTKRTMKFKAFITDFKDDYKTDYQKESVFGRSDPIVTYKSTERTITLGFTIPSNDLMEAKFNMWQVNNLIQGLYPTYDTATAFTGGATTIKGGPVWKLKYANLITRGAPGTADVAIGGLPGVLDGFSYDPIMEEGFMDEINQKGWTGDVFPQSIRVSFNYTVLHDTKLGWENGFWRGEDWVERGEGNLSMGGSFPYYPGLIGGESGFPRTHDAATPTIPKPAVDPNDAPFPKSDQKLAYSNYKPMEVTPPDESAALLAPSMRDRYREYLDSPDASNLDPAARARMIRFVAQSDAKHEGIDARLDAQPEARDQKTHNTPFERRKTAIKTGLLSPALGDAEFGFWNNVQGGIAGGLSALTFWDDDD